MQDAQGYGAQDYAANSSGQGAGAAVPAEIQGWNWGGFLLSWIWGIGNNVLIALVALIVPFWGIYLGIKGNELAWQNKRWDSVEHFKATQRKWAIAGLVVLGLSLGLACLAVFLTIAAAGTSSS